MTQGTTPAPTNQRERTLHRLQQVIAHFDELTDSQVGELSDAVTVIQADLSGSDETADFDLDAWQLVSTN